MEKKDGMPENITAETNETPKKKKSRKLLVVIPVTIIAIIAAVGVGFATWHEDPSFCGDLCHDTMGPYSEGFASGNESILVTSHANAGIECLDCHTPTISDQMNEAIAQITGDYTIPLPQHKFGTREFCLTCHDDGDASNGKDWEEIYASTENWGGAEPVIVQGAGGVLGTEDVLIYTVNVHEEHHGAVQCYSCHSVHGENSMYCNSCHDFEVPEGWNVPVLGA